MSHILAYWKIFWDEMYSYGFEVNQLHTINVLRQRTIKNGWGEKREWFPDAICPGESL